MVKGWSCVELLQFSSTSTPLLVHRWSQQKSNIRFNLGFGRAQEYLFVCHGARCGSKEEPSLRRYSSTGTMRSAAALTSADRVRFASLATGSAALPPLFPAL